MKQFVPLEKDIQMQICDYLAIKRYFFWRSNTTPVFDATKKVFRAMPKYAIKGVPDIIVIGDGGRFIGIEVKRPKGIQSDAQVAFQRACENKGGQYHLVHSLQEVINIL